MEVAPLQRLIAQASGTIRVLHDDACAAVASGLRGDVALARAGEAGAHSGRWAGVLVLAADSASLRELATTQPRIGRTKLVACWLAESETPVVPSLHPEWPTLASCQARITGNRGALTVFRFGKPVLANRVVEAVARAAGATSLGHGGVVVAASEFLAGAPVELCVGNADGGQRADDPERTVPPDVVLSRQSVALGRHPVIDRPPTVIDPGSALVPVDEGVLNPTGFLQAVDGGILTLASDGASHVLTGSADFVCAGLDRGATPAMVAVARSHQGVRIQWGHADPRATARAVAGLAAAGVPLVTVVPPEAGPHLAAALRDILALPGPDLGDPLGREEYSVRLRREALLHHSTRAWRSHLATASGVAFRRFPSVSVLMATRRPDMVEHALRQVAKQRGDDLDLELVLVTHGFSLDPERVRSQVPRSSVVMHAMPEDAFFGDVLNAALARASGDLVVKMDDDDWYGPDFLVDLLLAREYTGADLLGTTVEYAYLAPLDRTVRRNDDSERAARFVAGGSMLLGRSFLRELGEFRKVRKYVDAQVLAAVQAMGGHIYRSHGLGYMLRRNSTGHTWDPGLEYYLDEKRMNQQWDGFVPSRILEFAEDERP